MIDPASRAHNLASSTAIFSSAGARQPPKSQSFASAFSRELANPGSATQAPSANPSPGQGIVERHYPGVPAAGTRAPIPAPGSTATPAQAGADTSATGSQSPSLDSPSSFDATYWASQPAAVQQLQYADPADRTELATQLANQGYSIDVPIMVWGWDPATTMATRQADGYTWVPSALQQPVQVAPGLTYNGASYDPTKPPPGSIAVT